jgi:hypothetical protein
MLAGCGASQGEAGAQRVTPQVVISKALQGVATSAGAVHGRSWMLSEAKTSDLFYVSDQDSGDVYAYSWPKGKLEGTLTGFTAPSSLCSDRKGNVYVPNYGSENILEYAHGGTSPTKTLDAVGEYPYGCAVDPTTGDLAVTNISDASNGAGDLLIYKKAKGNPIAYTDSQFFNWINCGYDDNGNLFIDGYPSPSSGFSFAELAKGSSGLANININQAISAAGGIQWNGQYITVGNANGQGVIYEVQVSGSQGTVEGSTTLKKTSNVFQFWIQGTMVVAANIIDFNPADGNVGVWNYPGGGKATKIIGGFKKPAGVTVSLAK